MGCLYATNGCAFGKRGARNLSSILKPEALNPEPYTLNPSTLSLEGLGLGKNALACSPLHYQSLRGIIIGVLKSL